MMHPVSLLSDQTQTQLHSGFGKDGAGQFFSQWLLLWSFLRRSGVFCCVFLCTSHIMHLVNEIIEQFEQDLMCCNNTMYPFTFQIMSSSLYVSLFSSNYVKKKKRGLHTLPYSFKRDVSGTLCHQIMSHKCQPLQA